MGRKKEGGAKEGSERVRGGVTGRRGRVGPLCLRGAHPPELPPRPDYAPTSPVRGPARTVAPVRRRWTRSHRGRGDFVHPKQAILLRSGGFSPLWTLTLESSPSSVPSPQRVWVATRVSFEVRPARLCDTPPPTQHPWNPGLRGRRLARGTTGPVSPSRGNRQSWSHTSSSLYIYTYVYIYIKINVQHSATEVCMTNGSNKVTNFREGSVRLVVVKFDKKIYVQRRGKSLYLPFAILIKKKFLCCQFGF